MQGQYLESDVLLKSIPNVKINAEDIIGTDTYNETEILTNFFEE